MTRVLVLWLLSCTTVVHAAPHQVLVLRADGNAAAASRATIDSHVLRLAKHIEGKVEPGDITYADAAAAAGCSQRDAACVDQVLMTFAIDEMVATTVNARGGNLEITVRRLAQGRAPRAASTTIATGTSPEVRLDADIGPLFGAGFATTPLTEGPAGTPAATEIRDRETEPPAHTDAARGPVGPVEPPFPGSDPAPAIAPISQTPPEGRPPDRKLQKIGMGAGAGLVVLGILMWSSAASVGDEIDNAPASTPADFVRLQELERDADGLAGGGNLFFIAGIAVGAVSGYYYWKKGRAARTQTARITPVAFPGGGGLVLTIGGTR